jgi:hemolysin activation/secretion protein
MRRPHIADGNPDAKLRIQMKDGRVHEVVFGTARHLTPEETVEKFRANAGLVLDRDRVGRCIELVGRLETVADIGLVLDTVTTGK